MSSIFLAVRLTLPIISSFFLHVEDFSLRGSVPSSMEIREDRDSNESWGFSPLQGKYQLGGQHSPSFSNITEGSLYAAQ